PWPRESRIDSLCLLPPESWASEDGRSSPGWRAKPSRIRCRSETGRGGASVRISWWKGTSPPLPVRWTDVHWPDGASGAGGEDHRRRFRCPAPDSLWRSGPATAEGGERLRGRGLSHGGAPGR